MTGPGYPWQTGDALTAVDLNAAIANAASGNSFALNLTDFFQPGDVDDTASFNRAVAAAIAVGEPTEIFIPCGRYSVSGTINITTSGRQGVWLHGASSTCVTITQTADADLFVARLNGYGGQFQEFGAFRISGVALRIDATSTTRTALAISTPAPSGSIAVPMVIEDINLTSVSATKLWKYGIHVTQVPNSVNIIGVRSQYFDSSAGTTLFFEGTSSGYTSGVNVHELVAIGGLVGIEIGSWLQGVVITGGGTANTTWSIRSTPTEGTNYEYRILNCYLMGKLLLSPSGTATLNTILISGCFIAHHANVNGDRHVEINNVPGLRMINNTFNGPLPETVSMTGLYLSSPSVTPFSDMFIGNEFGAYGSGGTGVVLDATMAGAAFVGNIWGNNSRHVTNGGTSNWFGSSMMDGVLYASGASADSPGTPARFSAGIGVWAASSPPTSRPVVTGAKGGNAALASLLTALAAYGLVTDSTS